MPERLAWLGMREAVVTGAKRWKWLGVGIITHSAEARKRHGRKAKRWEGTIVSYGSRV